MLTTIWSNHLTGNSNGADNNDCDSAEVAEVIRIFNMKRILRFINCFICNQN